MSGTERRTTQLHPPDSTGPLRVRVLVTAISPPVPSAAYGAMATIVGLCLDEPRFWIRFDEVEAHPLGTTTSLRPYDVIRAVVEPDRADPRPESWKIRGGSLVVEGHLDGPAQRSNHLDRRAEWSMCDLENASTHRSDLRPSASTQSVALVRVAELRYVSIRRAAPAAPAEVWSLAEWQRRRPELFHSEILGRLTRPRFTLGYRYRCEHPTCRTHVQHLRDRDLVAFQHQHAHLPDRALWRALVGEFWSPLCRPGRSVAFLVGNRRDGPEVFDVLNTVLRATG